MFIVSNHNSQLSIFNSHFSFNSQLQLSTLNFQLSTPPTPCAYSIHSFFFCYLLQLPMRSSSAQSG